MRAAFISVISQSGEECTLQGLLGGIKDKQRKLQEAHERTKTVTRTGEMKSIRERMQARPYEPLADSNQCKAHPKGSRTFTGCGSMKLIASSWIMAPGSYPVAGSCESNITRAVIHVC